jgi:hypothetical protein
MKLPLRFLDDDRGKALSDGSSLLHNHGPTPSVRRVDRLSEEAAQIGI